jgi:hypothetical protein
MGEHTEMKWVVFPMMTETVTQKGPPCVGFVIASTANCAGTPPSLRAVAFELSANTWEMTARPNDS